MSSLFKLIRDVESRLHALLAELQEVKNKVRDLEQENASLRKELAGLHTANDTGDETSSVDKKNASQMNLLKLYEQGFHVCNINFGERRGSGCLFCMAFLRKENEACNER